MKTNLAIAIISLIFFFSCNFEREQQLSEEEIKELKKTHDDSIMLVLDSLYKVNIYVPPLYDKLTFDSATTINFFELAKATKANSNFWLTQNLLPMKLLK